MKQFSLSLILFLYCAVVKAQTVDKSENSSMAMASLNVSGGEAASSKGSVVYSIGTLFYTNIEAQQNAVSQSIQQAKELDIIDGKDLNSVTVTAYPNPTTDYVLIDIVDYENENAQYQLFDFRGSLIRSERITTSTTKLPMDNLETSTYFLKVSVMNKFEEMLTLLKL